MPFQIKEYPSEGKGLEATDRIPKGTIISTYRGHEGVTMKKKAYYAWLKRLTFEESEKQDDYSFEYKGEVSLHRDFNSTLKNSIS